MSYRGTQSQHRSSRRALRERRRAERGQRRRKIQALAVGGLVLGVGASATLAAWTDKESTSGSFASGKFVLEANTVGNEWEHTDTMQFDDAKLAPGHSVYAPVVLRSSVHTTVDGDVQVSGVGDTAGLNPSLQFRAVAVDPAPKADDLSCTAETFSSGAYVFGSENAYVPMAGEAQSDASQRLAAAQAETLAYCFEVRLKPEATDETQQLEADYTWTFHATSVTE